MTNAHVINGAEKIEVIVPPRKTPGAVVDTTQDAQGTHYAARIVGVTQEFDLAVVKIDGHALPALSIDGAMRPARQGEMVFAFGSPEGLRNTVTMGVVSAVARQPDPDSPRVYVQTDTPINPGNSGGALVDADGHLVGINTFMLSTSGGNQGLGFAIPSEIVAYAYPQLLKNGHVRHPSIDASLQTITPALAAGLHLAREFGIIVSDVAPRGPADNADLRVQDIILGVDGTPVENLPAFAYALDRHTRRASTCDLRFSADRIASRSKSRSLTVRAAKRDLPISPILKEISSRHWESLGSRSISTSPGRCRPCAFPWASSWPRGL